MSWISDFYLICFIVGFALTFISLLMGHVHFHFHVDSLNGAHGLDHGIGHPHHGHLMVGHGEISPINFSTIMAFLTWFGGMGYLLTHYYHYWMLVGLGLAIVSGLGGASLIFIFMAKILTPRQTALDPADYDLVGTLAHISSPIRENGTGEIIYSQAGVRRTSGARSADGTPLEKNSEVVITKYEKGIAYVQLWEEFAKEESN
jgi:hypothetical protein